jgi:hypothetical protein
LADSGYGGQRLGFPTIADGGLARQSPGDNPGTGVVLAFAEQQRHGDEAHRPLQPPRFCGQVDSTLGRCPLDEERLGFVVDLEREAAELVQPHRPARPPGRQHCNGWRRRRTRWRKPRLHSTSQPCVHSD